MLALRLAIAAIAVSALLADERSVDADPDVDFSRFRTFAIRRGNINSRKPELNSPLVRHRIEGAIRSELTAKRLSEDESRPDLVVTFRLGAAEQREVQRWPAGRFGRRTRTTT